VLAIEAQERVFLALAGNIAINNCFNARAICAAVASWVGEMGVPTPDYSRPGSFGSLELRHGPHNEDIGQTIDYASGHLTPVRAITVDSLNPQRLDLVKLDVEGMEQDALDGAQEVISRHHPILVIEHVKSDIKEMHRFLDLRGYIHFERGMNTVAIHREDPTLELGRD
jgi:FkbM family methyltransferase